MSSNKARLRIILIFLFLTILLTSILLIIFSEPDPVLIGLIGIITVILIILVHWHSGRTIFHCPACGHDFRISAIYDFLSPHTPEKKLVKCPKCGRVDWCSIIG